MPTFPVGHTYPREGRSPSSTHGEIFKILRKNQEGGQGNFDKILKKFHPTTQVDEKHHKNHTPTLPGQCLLDFKPKNRIMPQLLIQKSIFDSFWTKFYTLFIQNLHLTGGC